MATNPMEMGGETATEEVTESMPPEGQSSDYVIEVKISGQSILVGVESADTEMAEEGEGVGDEEQYQEVQSIGEACRLIREIYASQGQVQSPSAGAEQMAGGYK